MRSRVLVILGVLIPFLMSAYCVFSITYLFPEIARVMHVSISALSFTVTLSFIGGAVGGVIIGMIADATVVGLDWQCPLYYSP